MSSLQDALSWKLWSNGTCWQPILAAAFVDCNLEELHIVSENFSEAWIWTEYIKLSNCLITSRRHLTTFLRPPSPTPPPPPPRLWQSAVLSSLLFFGLFFILYTRVICGFLYLCINSICVIANMLQWQIGHGLFTSSLCGLLCSNSVSDSESFSPLEVCYKAKASCISKVLCTCYLNTWVFFSWSCFNF